MKSYKSKPSDAPTEEVSQAAPIEDPTEITETEIQEPQEQPTSPDNPDMYTDPGMYADGGHDLVVVGHSSHEKLSTTTKNGGPKWPTRAQLINWVPFWAVFLLGTVLRFWGLGDKPLHHDESLHAYFSLQLLHNLQNWAWCYGLNGAPRGYTCYHYDPLLHGPFQFHAIALVYQISQWLGAPDHGVNTTTVRIAAAVLGSLIVILPYFLRDYLGKLCAWIACFLLAVSPSLVYFSRFSREAIYMAFFTFLLVVAVARYMRERKMRWIILASAAFSLSYATSEATFLTIAVFGSFLVALIAWEIGSKFSWRERLADSPLARFIPRTYAPLTLLVYALIAGIAAKFFFAELHTLSVFITNPKNATVSNNFVANLKLNTVRLIPWLGILLGLYVLGILVREMYGKLPLPGQRRGLARFVDHRQPVLDSILTMPWTHWFFALIVGWFIFVLLFTVVFTNIPGGIGDGIWQGLYYWLQQQNVARGGQPWYYYLILIPLYEQIGVVFGIAGIIYSLWKPTRFRLFLIYWCLGNIFIYSWAAEKMPWLMIHMTMPMMLLAAIALQPSVMACYRFVKERFFPTPAEPVLSFYPQPDMPAPVSNIPARPRPRVSTGFAASSFLQVAMAVFLLTITVHNMYEVSYVHAADGPHEMMVYVQTTPDVNTVMAQIDALDQRDFGGKHQMRIAVTDDATWPFAWYLRDYPNLCFGFPTTCKSWVGNVPVIISGGDDPYGAITTYASPDGQYLSHQYHMRTWWDEGYKLPACAPGQTPSNSCSDPNLGSGVGPGLWLSYGDNPPPNAHFNLGLAVQRVWNWWWNRQALGSTDGAYDMVLFIHKGMGVKP